jgi:hypothetical protein
MAYHEEIATIHYTQDTGLCIGPEISCGGFDQERHSTFS